MWYEVLQSDLIPINYMKRGERIIARARSPCRRQCRTCRTAHPPAVRRRPAPRFRAPIRPALPGRCRTADPLFSNRRSPCRPQPIPFRVFPRPILAIRGTSPPVGFIFRPRGIRRHARRHGRPVYVPTRHPPARIPATLSGRSNAARRVYD